MDKVDIISSGLYEHECSLTSTSPTYLSILVSVVDNPTDTSLSEEHLLNHVTGLESNASLKQRITKNPTSNIIQGVKTVHKEEGDLIAKVHSTPLL